MTHAPLRASEHHTFSVLLLHFKRRHLRPLPYSLMIHCIFYRHQDQLNSSSKLARQHPTQTAPPAVDRGRKGLFSAERTIKGRRALTRGHITRGCRVKTVVGRGTIEESLGNFLVFCSPQQRTPTAEGKKSCCVCSSPLFCNANANECHLFSATRPLRGPKRQGKPLLSCHPRRPLDLCSVFAASSAP